MTGQTAELDHLLDRAERGVLLPDESARLRELVRAQQAGHAGLMKATVELVTSIGRARHILATEVLGWVEPGEDYSLDQIVDHVVAEDRADQSTIRRLTAGQCIDSRAMCEQHHAPPVDGCPYPRCRAARNRDQRAPTAPAEHCGHQPSEVFTGHHPGQYSECVLRPGHQGSHADQHGMRWWLATEQPHAGLVEDGLHLFEQNPSAPANVRVCRCGKWPDHHLHTGTTAPCNCDTCRPTA